MELQIGGREDSRRTAEELNRNPKECPSCEIALRSEVSSSRAVIEANRRVALINA